MTERQEVYRRPYYPRASHRAKHEAGKMNKTERAFADILEARRLTGEVLEWAFEPEKFRLADNTFYTPDFRVIFADEMVMFFEVKGHWEDDARVKIKVCAEQHPYPFRAIKMVKGRAVEEKIGRI